MRGSAPKATEYEGGLTALPLIGSIRLCAPDMGVNRWGESPLCVNAVNGPLITRGTLAKTLDRGNCGVARFRGKEARGQS